ncbi:LemA family protein [Rhodoferax sp.]|uniref:LemA family protein n=1 Tax=Rhodoferax sp. TaxID=50421 RepID=UPI0025F0A8A0|nr:LemA family protein [Rhodoferax sp.]
MISESVIWWSLSALLLFWSVGAYRRLGRLRSQTLRSFAALVVPMQRYADTVQSCPVNPYNPADPSPQVSAQAWAGLLGAQVQFSASLAVARIRSLDRAAINALVAADTVLQRAWTQAASDSLDAFGAPLPETLRTQWSDTRQQIRLATQSFAQAVQSYNTATTQFPAMLLAWLFGFHTATSLPTDS